jgi:hypothetical protein
MIQRIYFLLPRYATILHKLEKNSSEQLRGVNFNSSKHIEGVPLVASDDSKKFFYNPPTTPTPPTTFNSKNNL